METTLINIFIFVFGLIVGSFLNVCIYRLPREKSVVAPRSACPKCSKIISWYDNIPLLSYIILGGKCRNCGAVISFRYFLIELLTGLSFLAFYYFGSSRGGMAVGIIYLIYICALIVCTFIDFEFFIIPDEITLPGIVVGLLAAFAVPQLVGAQTHLGGLMWSFIGVLAGGGTLFLVALVGEFVLKKEVMGMGDVKLLAMIGAFLGWKLVLITVFLASVLGSIVGLALILSKKAKMQSQIPFGPYISAGSILAMFYGDRFISWYVCLIFPCH